MWAPTTEELLDLAPNVTRRADSFSFELCDRDWRRIGELEPRRDGISIANDATSNVSRRLSGLVLDPSDDRQVDRMTDRLRVYMHLQNGTRFLLGSFMWADSSTPLRSWGVEEHDELVDPTFRLDQNMGAAYGWERGAPIGLVMFFLLFRAEVSMDEIKVVGAAGNQKLSEPISWDPSATWLTALGDLCDIVGFARPWCDRQGQFVLDEPPDPETGSPRMTAYEAGGRIIRDSLAPSNDLLSSPNRYVVYDSGAEGDMKLGVSNVHHTAPHSYRKRGFRIVDVESAQGLSSTAAATRAAVRRKKTAGRALEYLEFNSTLDPRHETWDVVDALGKRWLETGWSMELRSGGKMAHKLQRTSYDPQDA